MESKKISEDGDPEQGGEENLDDGMAADYGLEPDDALCGPPTEWDMVDDALGDLINLLTDNDYDDETAEEAVFDALSQLTDEGAVPDTPDLDEPETVKAGWIANNMPKIKLKLQSMGLEFSEQL